MIFTREGKILCEIAEEGWKERERGWKELKRRKKKKAIEKRITED